MWKTKAVQEEKAVITTKEILDYPTLGELVRVRDPGRHILDTPSFNDIIDSFHRGIYMWIAIREQKRLIEPGVRGFTAQRLDRYDEDFPLGAWDAYKEARDKFDVVLVLTPGIQELLSDPIMIGLRKNDDNLYMIAHWD